MEFAGSARPYQSASSLNPFRYQKGDNRLLPRGPLPPGHGGEKKREHYVKVAPRRDVRQQTTVPLP